MFRFDIVRVIYLLPAGAPELRGAFHVREEQVLSPPAAGAPPGPQLPARQSVSLHIVCVERRDGRYVFPGTDDALGVRSILEGETGVRTRAELKELSVVPDEIHLYASSHRGLRCVCDDLRDIASTYLQDDISRALRSSASAIVHLHGRPEAGPAELHLGSCRLYRFRVLAGSWWIAIVDGEAEAEIEFGEGVRGTVRFRAATAPRATRPLREGQQIVVVN